MLNGLASFFCGLIENFYGFTAGIGFPSYALAIVLLTIVIKIILFPLNYKQIKSTKGLQQVQPLMSEIQKKYANNKQKQQQEMSKLYKKYDINPAAGCLPLLIQMPILIGLYRGMISFVPINPEHYNFLMFSLGDISNQMPGIMGWITPVLVAGATYAQTQFTVLDKTNQMQKTMLYAMPLMMGFISRQFQVGVGLYWITFSLLGIIQQKAIYAIIDKQKAKKTEAEKQAEIEAELEKEAKSGPIIDIEAEDIEEIEEAEEKENKPVSYKQQPRSISQGKGSGKKGGKR